MSKKRSHKQTKNWRKGKIRVLCYFFVVNSVTNESIYADWSCASSLTSLFTTSLVVLLTPSTNPSLSSFSRFATFSTASSWILVACFSAKRSISSYLFFARSVASVRISSFLWSHDFIVASAISCASSKILWYSISAFSSFVIWSFLATNAVDKEFQISFLNTQKRIATWISWTSSTSSLIVITKYKR